MHDAAFKFYSDELRKQLPGHVLEFGSYNINGTVRDAYPQAKSWWGIDIAEGNCVDEVADAVSWRSDLRFDVVICAEAFEHTPEWQKIITNAYNHLKKGGVFLASCATEARPPHSAFDGGPVREGEYYANVSQEEMIQFMDTVNWIFFEVRISDGYFGNDDLYIFAVK